MNEASTTPIQPFGAGVLVNMLSKPEWGPGKIVHVSGQNLHIIFRDLDEKTAKIFKSGAPLIGRADTQTDSVLDNLPPLTERMVVGSFHAHAFLLPLPSGSSCTSSHKASSTPSI